MSYCLGCLACQTACPAGVNYAELFETARSDIEQSGINDAPARNVWRALTLGFLFRNPRAMRAAGVVMRALPAERTRGRGPHVRPDDASSRDAAPAGAADAADGGGVFESFDCGERITGRRSPLPCRAPDRLYSGSRILERQPRYRGRAPRQRLCGRHAVAAAVLRIPARAQRRAGDGAAVRPGG